MAAAQAAYRRSIELEPNPKLNSSTSPTFSSASLTTLPRKSQDYCLGTGNPLALTPRRCLSRRPRRALTPNAAETHLHLGHALKLQERTEEARKRVPLTCAPELDPGLQDARNELVALGWMAERVGLARGDAAR